MNLAVRTEHFGNLKCSVTGAFLCEFKKNVIATSLLRTTAEKLYVKYGWFRNHI